MSSATSQSKTANAKPLLPPDERFWKRYSPHFEAPLAGMTSLCLHGLVLAFLILGGLAFFFAAREEASKPVTIDVAMMQDAAGTGGAPGPEGASGTPGDPGEARAEVTQTQAPEPTPAASDFKPIDVKVDSAVKVELLPTTPAPAPDNSESVLAELAKPRPEPAQSATKPGVTATAMRTPAAGSAKPGTGGQGGGTGPGSGKTGSGPGGGGSPGRGTKATEAEILAYRWNYDLSGDARQHADKLANTGFVVAFPDPQSKGDLQVVQDMRRRPVELRRESYEKYKDAVQRANTRAESVMPLARELQLPFMPERVLIFIPENLKQRMANEEARAAKQFRRDLKRVNRTWFDFRPLNGRYEPVVVRFD